jgi:hypothetical protein
VVETLAADVRSRFQTKRVVTESERGAVCDQPFDSVYLYYTWMQDGTIEVTDVKSPPTDILVSRAVQIAAKEEKGRLEKASDKIVESEMCEEEEEEVVIENENV